MPGLVVATSRARREALSSRLRHLGMFVVKGWVRSFSLRLLLARNVLGGFAASHGKSRAGDDLCDEVLEP